MRRDLRHISHRLKQGQHEAHETDDVPEVDVELTCPACKRPMRLRRHELYGLFWGCDTYVACGTKHGAHADGRPLGTPADQETKEWRVKAHDAFDPLWKTGKLTRSDAYEWLCQVMGKTKEEGHIGHFTVEECKGLIEKIEERDRSRLRRTR
jgi:ssDNA-binding Zn-finger/Zn-ribbon topoisomerase 1